MPSTGGRRTIVARTALIGVLAAGVLFAAWRAGLFALGNRQDLAAAIDQVRAVPYLAPLFVATYAVGAAVGVPATPLTLAGGALFGGPLGILLNWTGELLAAILAFAGTRATGLALARRGREAGDAAKRFASDGAARTLFRLRLVPVAPFSVLNVGAALSGMRWRDFIGATALGIAPITIIYTLLASELVDGVEGTPARAFAMASIAAVVLIGLSFLPSLIRRRGKTA